MMGDMQPRHFSEGPAGADSAPGKTNMMRANTEFVKSSQQMAGIRMRSNADPQAEKVRKSIIRLEAQKLADFFKPRIEMVLEDDDDMEEYTVEKHSGDMHRRFLAKVRISEDNYLHLCARRSVKKHGDWVCFYALDKDVDDPLVEQDPDYDELPKETVCRIAQGAMMCTVQ
eukprot:TRINITY_DN86023_c0_g1_i1.p1 TRINITY_DN86023_c0_g1~~TRINITY_DN86023_c0_g1_i1.p1  ORF type:complete len:171 (+),score=52.65 TRINITY_DN86023_c0_g1_i1:143-655(+)